MNNVTTLLWLDDMRNPFENDGKWLLQSPINCDSVIWVKSYLEFVNWINENGLPHGIAFDHDLGDVDELKVNLPIESWFDLELNREYTGMDCAKWLVNYCIDNNKILPLFSSHSSNTCGRENIIGLLNNFKKTQI